MQITVLLRFTKINLQLQLSSPRLFYCHYNCFDVFIFSIICLLWSLVARSLSSFVQNTTHSQSKQASKPSQPWLTVLVSKQLNLAICSDYF